MNLIINFTPTGMLPTKEMTPQVPISVNEIIDDVHEAFEIGITNRGTTKNLQCSVTPVHIEQRG